MLPLGFSLGVRIMRPPCEYVVKTYLPQVRARIIRNLIEEYNWKPVDVAKKLMISLPSVSKYKKILREITGISEEFAERVAREATDMIVRGEDTPEAFIELLCRNCMIHRIDGEICKIHRMNVPELLNCQACTNIFQQVVGVTDERQEVISNLMQAYSMLRSIQNFDLLIPEVRTNIVMAINNPKNIGDVAGFPGRLTTVKGKILAVTRPEFNASQHLAEILIRVNKKKPEIRGLICIKFNDEILKAIEKTKLIYTIFEREKTNLKSLEEFIEHLGEIPDILIDKGGHGIEPVTYVFGRNATDAAEKVIKIYESLT